VIANNEYPDSQPLRGLQQTHWEALHHHGFSTSDPRAAEASSGNWRNTRILRPRPQTY